MNFLREHFEKLILAVFVLGVFGVLFVTAGYLNELQKKERGELEFTIRGETLARVSNQDFTAAGLLSTENLVWKSADKQFKRLISPGRVMWCSNQKCNYWLPYKVDKCPYCGSKQWVKDEPDGPRPGQDLDDDGIDDKVENQYEFLSPENPADADDDYDNDWFSNKEEINLAERTEKFEKGTDPADKNDHPPLAMRLALAGVKQRLFPAVLKSGGGDTVQINTYGRNGSRSHFLSEGETFRIEFGRGQKRYTVKEISSKKVTKNVPGVGEITESVAMAKVQYKENEPIELVQGRKTYVGKKVGVRLYPDPADPNSAALYTVSANEPLVLEGPTGAEETYEVRVQSDELVEVRRKETGNVFEVVKSPEFLEEAEQEKPEGTSTGEGGRRRWEGLEEMPEDMRENL